jgi:tagatose 1,6-diphosphate aldolase
MISTEKTNRLNTIATPEGIIAALAIDQRRSLRQMIAKAAGKSAEAISDEQLSSFKGAVTAVLSQHTSAVLLDPEYGLEAAHRKAKGAGLLLAYESDGYENPRPHRMLALLPGASVIQLRDIGADAIKILLSWTPEDDPRANDQKRALVESIGNECEAAGMPFLLEPVVYDPAGSAPRSLEFAKRKPDLVVRTMEEFSKPAYKVDILKVEYPVIAAFVEGSPVYKGEKAQSHKEALDWFRTADSAAGLPYIYLSAGAGIAEFLASLELAAEAGAAFSGVLCGRAMWQDGIPQYAHAGEPALNEWLETEGVSNAQGISACLKAATPWHKRAQGAGE